MENRGSGVGNKSLLSVESALEKIIKDISVVSTEETSLTSAINRVTAVEVRARRCQPPGSGIGYGWICCKKYGCKDVSKQTEYVLEASPRVTIFVDNSKAEKPSGFLLAPHVPKGADTIVIQENVVATSETYGSEITVLKGAKRGIYIAGLDFKTGDVGIPKKKAYFARYRVGSSHECTMDLGKTSPSYSNYRHW